MDIKIKKSTKILLAVAAAFLLASAMLYIPAVQGLLMRLGGVIRGRTLQNPAKWIASMKTAAAMCAICALIVVTLAVFLNVFQKPLGRIGNCMLTLADFRDGESTKTFRKTVSVKKICSQNREFLLSCLLVGVVAVIFFVDGFNAIQYKSINYDDGYNATVAANFARYGVYKVSYPDDIVFYNMITTGTPVLLPTAILYKLFGINELTTAFIPLLYTTFSFVLMFIILCHSYGDVKKKYVVSAVMCVILLMSDSWIPYMSRVLQGEAAALFFLLLAVDNFVLFYIRQKRRFMFLSGFFVPAAFCSKSAMIFFVIVFFVLVLVDGFLLKIIAKRTVADYCVGSVVGFCFFDLFKFVSLGGIRPYIHWWWAELANMMHQSSGVDLAYGVSAKFSYLSDIFSGYSKYFCLALILLTVAVYVLYATATFKSSKKSTCALPALCFAGLGGSSLLCYFVLFGGRGLVYARRHSVNEVFVKFFFIYFIGLLFFMSFRWFREKKVSNKTVFLSGFLFCAVLFLFLPSETLKRNLFAYIAKDHEKSYSMCLTEDFLKEISCLPDSATLYCADWWQEPNITLRLDRKMTDINDVISGKKQLAAESYFIVGQLIDNVEKTDLEQKLKRKFEKINSLTVDYAKYTIPPFDRKDFDCFAIYALKEF